ncbi:MAG: hypothetical protein ACK50A_15125 [Sphingobacteriaceae bacterium]
MNNKPFLTTLIAALFSTVVFSQNYIRFTNTPISEKDLSKVSSVTNFNSNEPVYVYFELHEIEKMQLKESESIMIVMNFAEGIQSLDQYSMIGVQDNYGVVRGSGVVIPSTDNNAPFDINSIYENSFHMRLIDKMQSVSTQQKKWKLTVDKYEVQVYDHITRRNVVIDFGVLAENINRFPQFANKMAPKFELKKSISFTKELNTNYPFAEIKQKANDKAKALKEEIYAKLTGKTKAPKEYLENNFNGYDKEISRVEAEKLANGFFINTDYKFTKLSYFSTNITVNKKENGMPTYKYFYLGFYAQKKNGKCAYGTITIRSDYQINNSFGNWKCDTNKITDCECE